MGEEEGEDQVCGGSFSKTDLRTALSVEETTASLIGSCASG